MSKRFLQEHNIADEMSAVVSLYGDAIHHRVFVEHNVNHHTMTIHSPYLIEQPCLYASHELHSRAISGACVDRIHK